MTRIGQAELDAITQGVDLVALVRSLGVELKRTGKGYMGLCPFHDDRNPSLSVDASRNLWKCFGACAASGKSGGNAITFLMKKEGLSFPEALEKLKAWSGAPTARPPRLGTVTPPAPLAPPAPPLPALDDAERSRLLDAVVKHFEKTLAHSAKAQAYLRRRGLMVPELLRELRVGYSDGSVVEAVAPRGAMREKLVALGVLSPDGRDKLTGMVVVPLLDGATQAVVSLYGRAVSGRRHHYLDGPHRGLLGSSAPLTAQEIVIVESVLDAMSLMAMGHPEVLAIYGTNGFTAEHGRAIEDGPVKRVTLLLDNDRPGQLAAEALASRLVLKRGIEVRIATLKDHKDPNEALVAGMKLQELHEVLAAARVVSSPATPAAAAAAKEIAPAAAPEASAAPAADTPRPAMRYTTEDTDGGFVLIAGPRRYRVRGISGVLFERLFANVTLDDSYGVHQDRFDLYLARARRSFVVRSAKHFRLDEDTLERELGMVRAEAEARLAKVTKLEEETHARKEPPEPTADEREEALAFLKSPGLLQAAVKHMGCLGYVGEETNKALGYLVIVSRKLTNPLSALVISQSGAGKSGLSEVLERMTPPEDVELYSRLTSNALYYMDKDALKRKVVIIEERSGSEAADYSIRTLQSRKKLVLAVPMKDPRTGKTRTVVKEVLGPATFIETTASPTVNHENSTRCFELFLDESEEQTRRIHDRQRRARTLVGQREAATQDSLLKLHWTAQRLLRPVRVEIPFVDSLSFPHHWLRTRRDHDRFLNLVEASAFLHQYQRPVLRSRGAEPAISATVSDYRIAFELAKDILGSTLSDVKRPQRELLETMRAMTEERARDGKLPAERVTLTQRAIRERMGLPHHQVKRLVRELVELEYLEEMGSGRGRVSSYRLGAASSDSYLGLKGFLTPDELEARIRAGTTGTTPRSTS